MQHRNRHVALTTIWRRCIRPANRKIWSRRQNRSRVNRPQKRRNPEVLLLIRFLKRKTLRKSLIQTIRPQWNKVSSSRSSFPRVATSNLMERPSMRIRPSFLLGWTKQMPPNPSVRKKKKLKKSRRLSSAIATTICFLRLRQI